MKEPLTLMKELLEIEESDNPTSNEAKKCALAIEDLLADEYYENEAYGEGISLEDYISKQWFKLVDKAKGY